ncbi:MAG: hypothetical protein WCW27_05045 [Patescibacteria group bacterium]|jgi:hypothetical protein
MKMAITYYRLLKLAWKQYRLRFDLILVCNLIAFLPIYLLLDILSYFKHLNLNFDTVDDLLKIWQNPYFLGLQLFTTVAGIWVVTCILLMVKANYHQQLPSVKTLLLSSKHYLPKILLLSFITGSLILLGFIFFIVPGIILWLLFSLSLPALIWHNSSIKQALTLSWRLGKRYWWIILNYQIITLGLSALINLCLAALLPNVIGFTAIGSTLGQLALSLGTILLMVLFLILDEIDITALPSTAPKESC